MTEPCAVDNGGRSSTVCSRLAAAHPTSAIVCRMYCSGPSDAARRSAQSVQFHLLDSLTRILSPVVPHLCEEAYLYHPLNLCKSAAAVQC